MKMLLAAGAVVVLSGSAMADTINTTGTLSAMPSYATFSASTPTWISNATPPVPTGTPFWNDPSDDTGVGGSHLMNIGYALDGQGGFASSILTGGETTTGAQDLTASNASVAFNFVRNATSYNIALLYANSGEDTGNAASATVQGTTFGYYVGSTLFPLYNVGITTSESGLQAFNPTTSGGSWGFYATVCYAGTTAGNPLCETYETGGSNTGTSGGGAAWNHFALFQLADGNYVVGFTGQNGYFGEQDGDYQDVVVEIFAQAVPEPGTIAIMGLGLAALGVLGRRRFVKK